MQKQTDGIRLEYRIAAAHAGRGKIHAAELQLHKHNPFWSYARHLPNDWDVRKIEARTSAAERLLRNLDSAAGNAIDITPLKDDQRASGVVYGRNPLQVMYDIIQELAKRYPEYPFFGKWGGNKPGEKGRGFAFYVEDESDAALIIIRLTSIAKEMRTPLEIAHEFGPSCIRKFVTVKEGFEGLVSDTEGLRNELAKLVSYPHFFHELFSDERARTN